MVFDPSMKIKTDVLHLHLGTLNFCTRGFAEFSAVWIVDASPV